MLCKIFTLGTEIILLFSSPAPMRCDCIAEISHLKGDTVSKVFSRGCSKETFNIFRVRRTCLQLSGGGSFQTWPREFHPGSTSIFERGEDVFYLCFFSLPEVKWLLTNPKEVPLNINDTPTAPLLPGKR